MLTPDLKVRGIAGLRVFDASMMPSVPHAKTNAPTMAITDRAVISSPGQAKLRG